MKTLKRPAEEKWYMMDPVHVEHTVDFRHYYRDYPFDDMDVGDFFRIPREDWANNARTAIQRYYEKEPVTCFVVRKHEDEWICRRIF